MSEAASGDASPAARAVALEAGRVLFAGACRFVAAADAHERLPPVGAPEIAFVGRSNVGKSSLLNALVGRTRLARTSATPGRTRELVFFNLAERLVLVDMPGYGYAKASRTLIASRHRLAFAYLRGRPNLRRVLLLIDARLGVAAADREAMEVLDKAAVVFQIVLTKADALGEQERGERHAAALAVARAHPAAHPEVLVTSARRGTGIPEVRAELAALAA